MGIVVAATYAVVGFGLLAAGWTLYATESMDSVPLYDPETATNPAALAHVFALSLAAFAVATLAFAAFEAVDRTTTPVVAGYTTLVLTIALLAATRARKYE